jgi:hypothetical protein
MRSEYPEHGSTDSSKLEGWIWPLHLETLWDAPGHCPRCRTPMEPGALSAEEEKEPKLYYVRRRLLGIGLAAMLARIAWASGFRGEALTQMGPGMMGGHGMRGPGMMGPDMRRQGRENSSKQG